jgi:hypothetical protein
MHMSRTKSNEQIFFLGEKKDLILPNERLLQIKLPCI